MAKLPFKVDAIGKYQRSYDALTEEDGSETTARKLAQNLKWLEDKVPERGSPDPSAKNRLRDLINAGMALEQASGANALSALQNSPQKGTIVERAVDVLKDLYYGARDILSGKRVKTSLTITLGILIGAAIGAVLGTLVFPGIGSAAGGVVGAAIVASVASVGGIIGLSVLGAYIGSWFGKKISNKAFKQEKRFEVSHRITRKIKQRVGLSSNTVSMINGYLYNRAKSVKSPVTKKQYKALRRLGIMDADPTAMEKIACFFCQELALLEKEMQGKKASPELQKELEAVIYILKKLQKAKDLSLQSKTKIATAFNDYKKEHQNLPIFTVKQGLEYDSVNEVSPEVMAASKALFMQHLPELDIQSITATDKKSSKGSISYHYDITTDDGKRLPLVVFKRKKTNDSHYSTMVTVDGNQLTKDNQSQVTKIIVAQAKALYEKTGNTDVIVLAAGNDELAVQLVAAVLKVGLNPKLDDSEYPSQNQEAQARKSEIMEKAQTLAKDHTKSLAPKSRNTLDL